MLTYKAPNINLNSHQTYEQDKNTIVLKKKNDTNCQTLFIVYSSVNNSTYRPVHAW